MIGLIWKEYFYFMMWIHESHVYELQIETKFEVCDPYSFFYATYVVTRDVLWYVLVLIDIDIRRISLCAFAMEFPGG